MVVRQAVILCGGLGTRLGSLVKDTPKPMLPLGGKPVLQHTVELLKRHGITDIILAAGYKAGVIKEFFRDLERWGVSIHVSIEPEPLGTAGPLHLVKDRLHDQFLIIYGDVFIDFDLTKLIQKHLERRPIATILVRPSSHPEDAHLIQTDENHFVTELVADREPGRRYKNLGNCAIYVASKEIVRSIPQGAKSDFMKDVFPRALREEARIATHHLESSGFVCDMGTPERFARIERHLRERQDIELARRERRPIKAVFLDRDGVLNREVNLLHRPDQLEVLPGVPEAISLLNRHGIKTIVVTNQPVLARGLCETSALDLIHNRLRRAVENAGGHLDAIYYCPHHPETHHAEGVDTLRKGCDCRKPRIGMLMQAKEDLRLDLRECVMIGDSSTDIEAGHNAGVRTILLSTGGGRISADAPQPDYVFETLQEAVREIVQGKVQ